VVSAGIACASTIKHHGAISMERTHHQRIYNGGSRAEGSRRESLRLPLVERLPEPAIPCPWIVGYPDCH
jgi:hypothetical protein